MLKKLKKKYCIAALYLIEYLARKNVAKVDEFTFVAFF